MYVLLYSRMVRTGFGGSDHVSTGQKLNSELGQIRTKFLGERQAQKQMLHSIGVKRTLEIIIYEKL